MEEAIKAADLADKAYKVTPYGTEVFGFLVLVLFLYGALVSFAYWKQSKSFQEIAKESTSAMTLFIHENSGERLAERKKMERMEMKEVIRAVLEEFRKEVRDG